MRGTPKPAGAGAPSGLLRNTRVRKGHRESLPDRHGAQEPTADRPLSGETETQVEAFLKLPLAG